MEPPPRIKVSNPYKSSATRDNRTDSGNVDEDETCTTDEEKSNNRNGRKRPVHSIAERTIASPPAPAPASQRPRPKRSRPQREPQRHPVARLQSGLVLDHDEDGKGADGGDVVSVSHGGEGLESETVDGSSVAASYVRSQELRVERKEGPLRLYYDTEFGTLPASIEGVHTTNKTLVKCRYVCLACVLTGLVAALRCHLRLLILVLQEYHTSAVRYICQHRAIHIVYTPIRFVVG